MHADFNQLNILTCQHLKHVHKHNFGCNYDI